MNQQRQQILDRIAELPDDLWQACRTCATPLHRDQLRNSHGVCGACGYHFPLPARDRIGMLVDSGSFHELDPGLSGGDPLGFVDRMPYPARIARAREKTGLVEAAVAGTATLARHPVVIAALDFAFLGGSMGPVVGEKITRAAELAHARLVPLIVVSSSGGARMQEGIFSLLQMAKTASAIGRLRSAGVPFISVLADPVYGGVAASFAALGDVIIAERGARAGFAGPQVIRQTIRQELPPGFQTAQMLYSHGHVDLVLPRQELPATVRELTEFFTAAREPIPPYRPSMPPGQPGTPDDAWQAVRLARTVGRPTTLEYVNLIFDRFVALHGDRWSSDDEAVVGGPAFLGELPVVVVGHCKGRDTPENVRRNFGMPHPAGYRKAMRLFGLADRLGVPVVTFVDTPGAYPGIHAEQSNQSGAIAETLLQVSQLRVPVVSVITGEGGSGGALALATGDRLLMQENAVYSVISPEGCATILFGDAGRAPDAAKQLRLSAPDLLRMGIADELVPEPGGGAHTDPPQAASAIAAALRRTLADLMAAPADELLRARLARARSFDHELLTDTHAASLATDDRQEVVHA